MEQKQCKKCQKEFTVTDDDLAFYKKISPTFNGKTFEIPAPTMCPNCRRQRRLIWRNNNALYSRKCDKTGEMLISPFAPNSKHKVYKNSVWWSDDWDPIEYGRDYDPNRSFFEQLQELHLEVPTPHNFVSDMENTEYANCSSGAKNSYLVQSVTDVENCYYCKFVSRSKDCIDCLRVFASEKCYECVNLDSSYECYYCTDSHNCSESLFLDHCQGCKNCFGCTNLQNKQYWIYNKESTKEEYEKIRNQFLSLTGKDKEDFIKKVREYLVQYPKRYSYILKSEACSGNQIYSCKNANNCFYTGNSENLKNCFNLEFAKDSMDHDFWGEQTQTIYESVEVGDQSSNISFCRECFGNVSNVYYSILVGAGSSNCFGCVGLRHKEYCILNKQYTKEEYDQKVAEIIANMEKSGEWGEFFPVTMSPFGYNESLAQDYFPLSKEQATKSSAKWQDQDFSPKYEGSTYTPKDIKFYQSEKNPKAQEEINKVLSEIIKCETTGKPFKLQAPELAFYIKNNIQIPTKHPDQRHKERFELTNPLTLWHRQCDCEESGHDHSGRCPIQFETTYAPDRPEKIYCEECYQKIVK